MDMTRTALKRAAFQEPKHGLKHGVFQITHCTHKICIYAFINRVCIHSLTACVHRDLENQSLSLENQCALVSDPIN